MTVFEGRDTCLLLVCVYITQLKLKSLQVFIGEDWKDLSLKRYVLNDLVNITFAAFSSISQTVISFERHDFYCITILRLVSLKEGNHVCKNARTSECFCDI